MKARHILALFILVAAGGCKDSSNVTAAVPREPGPGATGYYCRMTLAEHTGPFGQLLLRGWDEPLWFSSVRDALTYVGQDVVGEEEIAGFWVNDMGTGPWGKPAPGTWIEAQSAWYVAGSRKTATMGGADVVPFKERNKAEDFASEFGGSVVTYATARDVALGSLIADGRSGGNP